MDARQILADNIKALKDHYKLSNAAIAKKSGVGNGTIGRACLAQVALDIDSVKKIAQSFGLEAWQLLAPNLNPGNPHHITQITDAEEKLYRRLRDAMKTEQ